VLLGLLGFAAPLLTDLLGAVWQRDLEAQLERMAGLQRWRGMEAGVGGRTVTATVTAELRPTQARRTHPRGRDLGSGVALCRIEIPAIDLSAVVVSGVEPEHLAKGPGHYPGTAVPGGQGNVCIAGHRVTFGHPFGRLDELEPGDSITLEVSGLPYEYRVDEVYAVPREDNSPLRATEGDVLTLTTCHPPHSSRERLIVRALRIPADPVDEWLMGA
jgi:sortase A